MRYKHRRFMFLPDDAGNVCRHRQTRLIVQRGKRFIQQQDRGLRCERADQRAALAHPAGELRGQLLGKIRKIILLQQLAYPCLPLRRVLPADLQAERHVAPDRPPRKQLIALRHESDLCRRRRYRLAVEQHLARRRPLQSRDQGQQRGFSAAGRSDDAHKFAVCHVERHIAQRLHFPIRGLVGHRRLPNRNPHADSSSFCKLKSAFHVIVCPAAATGSPVAAVFCARKCRRRLRRLHGRDIRFISTGASGTRRPAPARCSARADGWRA